MLSWPRNPKETPLTQAKSCEMREMLGDESCDVTLVPSREPAQRLGAHKCILAMRSGYFQELFSRPARCCSKPPGQVILEDLTLSQLQALLGFIYADEWTDEPFFAREMLPMASKFDLPALRGLCERSLVGALDVESCAEILALADEHGCERLRRRAVLFMGSQLQLVMKSKGFSKLEKRLIIEVLQNQEVLLQPTIELAVGPTRASLKRVSPKHAQMPSRPQPMQSLQSRDLAETCTCPVF